MMRGMRMGLLGSLLGLIVLPVSCSGDDSAPAGPGASGGSTSNTTGGTGGSTKAMTAGRGGGGGAAGATLPNAGQSTSAAGESAAGQGGAEDGTAELTPEARRELCTQICTTEMGLPCAMDIDSCVTGWCDQPMQVFPQCLGVYDVMLRCMVQRPLAGFECQGGSPEPTPESCAGEEAAIVACVEG